MSPVIVIAASAGGLDPLVQIIKVLPSTCRASVFIVNHIGANRSYLPDILAARGSLPAAFARHGEVIAPGRIYVAPPDHHMRPRFGMTCLDQAIRLWMTPHGGGPSSGPSGRACQPPLDPVLCRVE